jgi:glycosyltransferase involved in cell wall biosynthesis
MIANSNVGDTKEFTEDDKVGYVIDDFNDASYLQALETVDKMLQEKELAERCTASAKKRFDLVEIGGKRYLDLYSKLLKL